MNTTIPINVSLEKDFVIEEKHIASFLGTGDVAVFATPAMIWLMEGVSRDLANKYMEEGFTTVGTEVCIKHLAAAPKGSTVTIKAEIVSQNAKKILFNIECRWKDMKIGEGKHERAIVNHQKFMHNLMKKLDNH